MMKIHVEFFFCSFVFASNFLRAIVDHVKGWHYDPILTVGQTVPDTDQLPTIKQIRSVIPQHCFKRCARTSLLYTLGDLLGIVTLFLAIHWVHSYDNDVLWWVSMILYYGMQGTLFAGIMLIGHDCGHGSFSEHDWLNHVVGTFLHSIVLMPYTMFRLTHRDHHKNTNNYERDRAFYPRTLQNTYIVTPIPYFGFGLSWYLYLITDHHFDLRYKLFRGHTVGGIVSLCGMAVTIKCLHMWAAVAGWKIVMHYYGVPMYVFGSIVVLITFMQHNEVSLPWYNSQEWRYMRGQLSTVDRDFGCIHKRVHSVTTHQLHHIFPKMPHYHLDEATVHFRKAFPGLVRYSEEPFMHAFLRMFRKFAEQYIIKEGTKIHLYH